MKVEVLGVDFDSVTLDEAISAAFAQLNSGSCGYIVTPNPEIVWECRKNEELRAAVRGALLTLPDGVGIMYGAKILGRPINQRIPGIDFASKLFERLRATEYCVFLLGARPGVADRAAEKLRESYPGLLIAGAHDGYFDGDAEVVREINASGAAVAIVCLGSPKQELWMRRNAGSLSAKLCIGLGGALDVFSGEVLRAPEGWRKHGFEWLYRLLRSPSRIKRMFRLPAFILAVLWEKISKRESA